MFHIGEMLKKEEDKVSLKSLRRIEKSKMNATIALTTSILMGLLSFVERMVFNRFFIEDYLGLYSFYYNVLGILTSIELGLPTAIAYALYAPLEYNNIEQITAIVDFYKRISKLMGTIILIAGIALLPFLKYFIKTEIPIGEVQRYFIMYLLGVVCTYFISARKILLTANQEQYKITFVTNLTWTLLYIAEIAVAITTKSFYWYSACILISAIARNIILNILTRKEFPEKKLNPKPRIASDIKKKILRNYKGLVSNSIGRMMVSSTDSILISTMVGTAFLGRYSNYQMITSGLLSIAIILPNSITASIGNAGVTESRRTMSKSFETLNLSSFFIYSTLTILLMNIINPIVSVFFGNRTIGDSSVILICINFYISSLRELLLTYKSSLGLYWEDRKRPFAEGVSNLVISIVLGHFWGFNGIILGTIITNICINLVIEPQVIFHNGLYRSTVWYYISLIRRFALTVLLIAITTYINSFLQLSGILLIITRAIISLALTVICYFVIYRKNENAIEMANVLKVAFKSRKANNHRQQSLES